jgi:hypothetical protein
MSCLLKLVACCLLTGASSLRIGLAAPARAPALSRCRVAAKELSEDSTLADLRVLIKRDGLNIKTTGPGRTRAAVYKDVLAAYGETVLEAGPVMAAEVVPEADEPVVVAEAEEPEEPAEEPAEEEVEWAPPPPDGFEWGASY